MPTYAINMLNGNSFALTIDKSLDEMISMVKNLSDANEFLRIASGTETALGVRAAHVSVVLPHKAKEEPVAAPDEDTSAAKAAAPPKRGKRAVAPS